MNVSNTYNQVFVGSRIDGAKTHFHQNKLHIRLVPDENVLYPTAGLSKSFVLSSSLFILAPVCSLYSELLREVWSLWSLVWLPAGVQIPISANCLRTCKDSTDHFVSTRSDSKKGRKIYFQGSSSPCVKQENTTLLYFTTQWRSVNVFIRPPGGFLPHRTLMKPDNSRSSSLP